MNFEVGSIYTIKLTSGEELVAKVISDDAGEITIAEPLSVAPSQQGIGLMPSMFTADPKAETKINKSTITVYALTDDSVRVQYIKATTGIMVPEKKLILG